MRDRIRETVFRNINCAAHIMLCMVLTALLLAGNAAFVYAEEAEIVCVMERTGDGKLGMRIDAGKNSGIDAYDLDVVYDPQSVRPVEAEARGGEPTAFAYQDINDKGVFRIVGLMQEPLTKAGTFLYIKWEPISEDDIQYVPALTVRDLANSEGEDLSYGISYTGVDGGAVTPSPAKRTENDSANGGRKAIIQTRQRRRAMRMTETDRELERTAKWRRLLLRTIPLIQMARPRMAMQPGRPTKIALIRMLPKPRTIAGRRRMRAADRRRTAQATQAAKIPLRMIRMQAVQTVRILKRRILMEQKTARLTQLPKRSLKMRLSRRRTVIRLPQTEPR